MLMNPNKTREPIFQFALQKHTVSIPLLILLPNKVIESTFALITYQTNEHSSILSQSKLQSVNGK